MSDTTSGKLKEQGLSNLDVTKVASSPHEAISSQATNNIEPEDHSQKSTSCTKKQNKLEKNIKGSTSTVTPYPIYTSRTSGQKIYENRTKSHRKLLAPNYKNTNKFKNMDSTTSNNEKGKVRLGHRDNAILETNVVSNMLKETNPALYRYIVSDKRALRYILSGKMLNLETETADDPYDPKEIDRILDHIVIFGEHFYLVKWKNWSKGFNTWERFGDLTKSQLLLGDYIKGKTNYLDNIRKVNVMHIMLSKRFVSKLFDLFRVDTGVALPWITRRDLSGMLDRITNDSCKENLNGCLGIMALSCFRYVQLKALKQWEINMNVLSNSYNILVENNIDLEGPQKDSFVYVTRCVLRENVNISKDPPISCKCTKGCTTVKKCCNELAGYSRTYDTNKCIIVDPGCVVFECNDKCKCQTDCYNRVVQLGSNVHISVYRTEKCGWGVKANQYIKKGKFIALYTGEIITIEESKNRLKKNASSLEHTMWNLNYDNENNCEYIIDASNYGNFTRFINHSCNYNLNMYTVWTNKKLPELALFANTDISQDDQLTINYFSPHSKNKIMKKTGIRCLCNEVNCQSYYL